MKIKNLLMALAIGALIGFALGCQSEPVGRFGTNNAEVPVELLFEHDGCKMFRFYDGGGPHYFAKCPSSSNICHTESCGKGCTREACVKVLLEER